MLLPTLLVAHTPAQRPLNHLHDQPTFINSPIFRHHPQLLTALGGPKQHVCDDFQEDIPYEGIAYFAHTNSSNCFTAASDTTFDIGIIGAPFNLGVTYRPGARFGPAGTRMGSRRLSPSMAYRLVAVRMPSVHPYL